MGWVKENRKKGERLVASNPIVIAFPVNKRERGERERERREREREKREKGETYCQNSILFAQ